MSSPASIVGSNPFQQPGEWLKCALHTHTTESDGSHSPRMLVDTYRDAGFDVVAITDHWRRTIVSSTERLITIPGAELCFDLVDPPAKRLIGEFLVYGITDLPADPGGDRNNWWFNEEENYEIRTFENLTAGMQWVESQKAVAYVAHPYWSGLDVDVLKQAHGYLGLEVFNGSSELETGRGDSASWWDALLSAGRRTFAIATDDQHVPLFDLGTAWTMVRAHDRTPEAVLQALRTGMAYSSNGPTIYDVVLDGTAVEVSCSPARSIVLGMEEERGVSVSAGARGRRFGSILRTSEDGLITAARVESPWPDPRFRRITVVDEHGRKAWTNPL
ncbi:MAG TPA: CehA/McbA family metallohydrolase [Actinomycetes bacterium]|nr:CehA/McbA family metallohydrolase [Actinomycetes bacterium]